MNTVVIERCRNRFIVRPKRSVVNGIIVTDIYIFENIENCFKFLKENMDFKSVEKVKDGAK